MWEGHWIAHASSPFPPQVHQHKQQRLRLHPVPLRLGRVALLLGLPLPQQRPLHWLPYPHAPGPLPFAQAQVQAQAQQQQQQAERVVRVQLVGMPLAPPLRAPSFLMEVRSQPRQPLLPFAAFHPLLLRELVRELGLGLGLGHPLRLQQPWKRRPPFVAFRAAHPLPQH